MYLCLDSVEPRVLARVPRDHQNLHDRARHVADLGLSHIAEAEWPAFERGLCSALVEEAPHLATRLQSSVMMAGETASSSCSDGSGCLVFDVALEQALEEFVRSYATRWGIWEGVASATR